jgi:hypothetical protein
MKYLRNLIPLSLIFFTFIFFAGCKNNDSMVNNTNNTPIPDISSTSDAAYAVAANVSIDNGGVFEEMSDVMNTATPAGIHDEDMTGMMNFGDSHTRVVSKIYDSTSGWWTVTITRHRGNINGRYYADYSRVYKHQFLNKDGQFQEFYITNNDTAYSIKHEIVSGTGILKTPNISYQLTALAGAWTVTGTNTSIVTLNTSTPYVRAVSDTMTRNNSIRTLNGTLTLNFINVVGPRLSGFNWHRKVSGTIDGTYHAVVTFQKGGTYTEKTIDKTIHIVLGDKQTAEVDVDNAKFNVDLETGDVSQM